MNGEEGINNLNLSNEGLETAMERKGLKDSIISVEEDFFDLRKEIELLLNPEKLETLFVKEIKLLFPENMDKIVEALNYAKKHHKGQYRDELTPYYTHGIHVALYLIEDGANYEAIIVALLHDVLEDSKTADEQEMNQLFGNKITYMVKKLSKMIKGEFLYSNEEDYYNELEKDLQVLRIKGFDSLSNVLGLYFVEEGEYKSSYGAKIKKFVLPMIERAFPDIHKRFMYVYDFIEANTMTDNQRARIELLKSIAESKGELRK